MANAFDPDALDPDLQFQRNSDEAWRANLALIREFSEQEKQAEADRALAAELAGITIDKRPDHVRGRAMLLHDFDDDDPPTVPTTMNTGPQSKP